MSISVPRVAVLVAVIAHALLAPAAAGERDEVKAGGGAASGEVSLFVAGFEALPLMPGLENVGGGSVEFDTPSGRIVETVVEGPVSADAVLAFYGRTLPQLGWEPLAETQFQREGEILKLELLTPRDGEGNRLTVRFFLSPK